MAADHLPHASEAPRAEAPPARPSTTRSCGLQLAPWQLRAGRTVSERSVAFYDARVL